MAEPKFEPYADDELSVEELIDKRQKEYGGYDKNSELTQALMNVWQDACIDAGAEFNAAQKEGIHMVFHKLSRMTFGAIETRRKHTHDFAGYAKLTHQYTP